MMNAMVLNFVLMLLCAVEVGVTYKITPKGDFSNQFSTCYIVSSFSNSSELYKILLRMAPYNIEIKRDNRTNTLTLCEHLFLVNFIFRNCQSQFKSYDYWRLRQISISKIDFIHQSEKIALLRRVTGGEEINVSETNPAYEICFTYCSEPKFVGGGGDVYYFIYNDEMYKYVREGR